MFIDSKFYTFRNLTRKLILPDINEYRSQSKYRVCKIYVNYVYSGRQETHLWDARVNIMTSVCWACISCFFSARAHITGSAKIMSLLGIHQKRMAQITLRYFYRNNVLENDEALPNVALTLSAPDRFQTSKSDVYGRQILTSKFEPRAERITYLKLQ